MVPVPPRLVYPKNADPASFQTTAFFGIFSFILLINFQNILAVRWNPRMIAGLPRRGLYFTEYAVSEGLRTLCQLIQLLVGEANTTVGAADYEIVPLNKLEAFLDESISCYDVGGLLEAHSDDDVSFATILRFAEDYLSRCPDCQSTDEYIYTSPHFRSMCRVVTKFRRCINALRLIWLQFYSSTNAGDCQRSTHQLYVCVVQLGQQLGLSTVYAPLSDYVPKLESRPPLRGFELPCRVMGDLFRRIVEPLEDCSPLLCDGVSAPSLWAYSQKLRAYDAITLQNLAIILQATISFMTRPIFSTGMDILRKHYQDFVDYLRDRITGGSETDETDDTDETDQARLAPPEQSKVYVDTLTHGISIISRYETATLAPTRTPTSSAELLRSLKNVLEALLAVHEEGTAQLLDLACRKLEKIKGNLLNQELKKELILLPPAQPRAQERAYPSNFP